MKNSLNRNNGDLQRNEDFWFPGRYVGGISIGLAALLVLKGLLFRME